MRSPLQLSLITAVVNKAVANSVKFVENLKTNSVTQAQLLSGRITVLEERKGPLALISQGNILSNDQVDIYSFLVSPEKTEDVLHHVSDLCGLWRLGRGSVYSESVRYHGAEGQNGSTTYAAGAARHSRLQLDLMGICCIVQRGQGDRIARIALESGACVPITSFGLGTGVRDKLGLLRITVAAEKEVIRIVTSRYDADLVMELMIEAGKLDQPAKGFIYQYPIAQGMVDTKVSRGMARHAASIEQIIAVLDELKGGAAWRSREQAGDGRSKKRVFLSGLTDLTVLCNDGRGTDLVKAAMAVGASGATVGKTKRVTFAGEKVSPAREMCSMIVGEKNVPAILEALEKAGLYGEGTWGEILLKPVPKAFTYIGK